ncbi:MAG: preprotein translocase subunit YajC [Alphaproteobacteria bacterium]
MFVSTAWAQDAAGGAGGGGDMLVTFLPLILIFAIFYFLLIRPQQKKQKEHQAKLKAVRRGDRVLTGGGIYGSVTKVIDDNEVQVEIAEGVRVRCSVATLMDVMAKGQPVKEDAKK